MSNQEAWNKFMQTGRVDYYLLSRGINIYVNGVFPTESKENDRAISVGGDDSASKGFGHSAESSGDWRP